MSMQIPVQIPLNPFKCVPTYFVSLILQSVRNVNFAGSLQNFMLVILISRTRHDLGT